MTATDVRALVLALRKKIIGLRVTNVYDITSKQYILKLANKGVKELLLIEAGIRIHATEFMRPKNNIPSGFCMKVSLGLLTSLSSESTSKPKGWSRSSKWELTE